MRRHQHDSKTFSELSYKEQALAINAHLLVIWAMIGAHRRRAAEEGRPDPLVKCVRQLVRLVDRIRRLA